MKPSAGSSCFRVGVVAMALAIASTASMAQVSSEVNQAQDEGRQEAAGHGIPEIIVTSRKRVENVQIVSESITVTTGDELEQLQIVDQRDLTRVSPALTFRPNPIPTSSGFAVRGIGTSSFSSTLEQSVSTVLDGVVLGQPQSAAALIDISRVEVLEGPQGLLFGKNASAGLVNIVTQVPNLEAPRAELTVTVGSDGEFRNAGILNLPVSESVGVRLVGFRNQTDGYIENVYLDEEYNGEDNFGGRAKLLFEPDGRFSLLVSADYAKDTSACCFSTALELGANQNLANYFDEYGITPGPGNREVVPGNPYGSYPGAPFREYRGLSVQSDAEIGDLSLTSISAYRRNRYILDFDGDQTPVERFDYNGGRYDYEQYSQELRLASPAGETIEWLAGLFYFGSTNDIDYRAGGHLLGPTLPLVVAVIETDVRSLSYAGFGSATWNVRDRYRLRVGGRWTRDEIEAHRVAYDLPGSYPGSSAIIGSTAGDTVEEGGVSDFSWKLTAEHDVAADAMVYANIARGYKGPGLTSSGVIPPGGSTLIRPETVMAYDLGIKSMLFDRRLKFNAALFYERFKDFQTQVYDTSTSPPGFRTTNAGGLVTQGVEAQLSLYPLEGLILSANGAYIDGEYRDLDGLSCPYAYTVPEPSNGCRYEGTRPVIDASGNRLANSPKLKFNLAAIYTRPVSSGTVLEFAADYAWRSEEQFSANGDPKTVQPAYGILNLSLGASDSHELWEVRAFVRNVFDKHYVDLISPNPADTSGGYVQYFSRYQERQAGVTLRLAWGGDR